MLRDHDFSLYQDRGEGLHHLQWGRDSQICCEEPRGIVHHFLFWPSRWCKELFVAAQRYTGLPERILVVTEKPSSASRIAQALDLEGRPETGRIGEVTFYVASRGDAQLVVASALGHLYSIVQKGVGWNYPVYEMKWVPANQGSRGRSKAKAHIRAFRLLGQDASEYVSACDYDIEGSLIAYNVLRYAVGERSLAKAGRMLYSTLTREDLIRSWENRSQSLDYPVIAAGKARHETDWLYGINLSRALTLSVRETSGRSKTLSIGRVQGPTLGFIKRREDEINSFVPVPYWKVSAETEIGGEAYPLEYEKPRLEREKQARELTAACRGKTGLVTGVHRETVRTPPPPPFNLGDLQREAYRVHRLSPSATLSVAEKLYLGAYISYPRTSSQRLPPSIDLKEILGRLRANPEYAKEAEALLSMTDLKPRQGKKDDPAHPAIHPTGATPRRLSDRERRVYDLITRRFLACLAEPAVTENLAYDVDVGGHIFSLRGSVTTRRGWLDYYPYVKKMDQRLPELEVGQELHITKLSTRRGYTKPPSRFNASSLLRLMESEGVGTKATRTTIIDTLEKRGYIEGESIRVTDLGYGIVETLEAYCPEILSVEMTRGLEADLEAIQTGGVEADKVVEEAVEELKPILAKFRQNEGQIGSELSTTLKGVRRSDDYLGRCPACGAGDILLGRNSKTGAVYASCSNPGCKQRYALPQKKRIHPTGNQCDACGSPVIKLYFNRKPWEVCINPSCPLKEAP
ncbi:DNA topoisomerase I [Candidatus Bathyarchaeota archaeon]|nr:DNA topoisomerase I [Candidatus Bathyarchaeota archaeon]